MVFNRSVTRPSAFRRRGGVLAVLLPGLVLLQSSCASTATSVHTTAPVEAERELIRQALATESALDPAALPTGSVGVLPLSVSSSDSTLVPLGFGLAELLMGDLAQSAELTVVDRLRIHALMQELALAGGGVVEANGQPRQGRLIGARHLVVGSLTTMDASTIRVDARLAATADASVRDVVSASTALDDILEAETRLALEVFDALGVTLTPAEREAVVRRPTRSLAALLAFSRGVRAEMQGALPEALREYRRAAQLDREFSEPRERLRDLERYFPDVELLATLLIDLVNRPGIPNVSDVTEPAYRGGEFAGLVIPIVIR